MRWNYERYLFLKKLGFNLLKDKFKDAIILLPDHPGAFNDRAQLFRVLRKEDEALQDLNKSLELSKGIGSVASQSYTQVKLRYIN